MILLTICLSQLAVVVYGATTAVPLDCYTEIPGHNFPTCSDKYAVIPGHIFCLDFIHRRPLSESEANEIEKKHNTIRSNASPPAANMMSMKYNIGLGRTAQMWAETCNLRPSYPIQRFRPGSYTVGENILVSSKPMNWSDVIDTWAKEKSDFVYGSAANDPARVSNYTQLVWAESAGVGCSAKNCSGTYFYVCNYAPAMEANNINKPYINGSTSCTMCSLNCTDSLCDCKGVICLNGGEVDYQTCSCNCVKEVHRYETPVCDLFCEDNGDDPACGTTYQKISCLSDFKTMYHCPRMCDLCPYAGKNYTEGSELLPWQKNRKPCTTPTTTTTTSTARTTAIGSANPVGSGGTTIKPTSMNPISTDTVTTKPTTLKPAATNPPSSATMTQAPTSTGTSAISSTTSGQAGHQQGAGSGGNAAASLHIISLWSLIVMINAVCQVVAL